MFIVALIVCRGSVFVPCFVVCTLCPSFAIILMGKRKLFALLYLSSWCILTIYVLWLFLTVPWAGLQCVNVVFPDHTYLLFKMH